MPATVEAGGEPLSILAAVRGERGALASILRQAKVSRSEFLELLGSR